MKRLFCYVLMLIYSCFLISCGHAVDKDNLFEMPEEELETAGEEAGNAVLESDKEHNTENDPADDSLSYTYAYGNMQKNVPPGNFAEYGDSILSLITMVSKSGFMRSIRRHWKCPLSARMRPVIIITRNVRR